MEENNTAGNFYESNKQCVAWSRIQLHTLPDQVNCASSAKKERLFQYMHEPEGSSVWQSIDSVEGVKKLLVRNQWYLTK